MGWSSQINLMIVENIRSGDEHRCAPDAPASDKRAIKGEARRLRRDERAKFAARTLSSATDDVT